MLKEIRMIEDFEIIHAIHIGEKEVVLGADKTNESDFKYMCSYCDSNEIFSQYNEIMISGDYLEIMKLFCDRVNEQIESVRTQQEKENVPLNVITADMCYTNDSSNSIEGKIVAIKASVLRDEYRMDTHQLILVTGGFGAAANARGNACFTTNLHSGKSTRWERYDVQGEVKPECMPQWAKEKITAIQENQLKSKNETIDRQTDLKPKDLER